VRAPDYVEPIIGWRAWLVVDDEGEIRLSSVVHGDVWVPRCELVANCQRSFFCFPRVWRKKPSDHRAPTEACYCGIYGVRDAEHAAGYLINDLWRYQPLGWPLLHRAIGRVFLWGSVVESEKGWRASRAYPERIYLRRARQADRRRSQHGRRSRRGGEGRRGRPGWIAGPKPPHAHPPMAMADMARRSEDSATLPA
jgi:hypothetical protein